MVLFVKPSSPITDKICSLYFLIGKDMAWSSSSYFQFLLVIIKNSIFYTHGEFDYSKCKSGTKVRYI